MKHFAIAIISAAIISTSAIAGEIDFSAQIKNIDGTIIRTCELDTPACKTPTTLAAVASAALLADDPKQPTTGTDKVKRYVLAVKVYPGGKISLPVEDITLIKERIATIFPPLIVGRSYDILDPK